MLMLIAALLWNLHDPEIPGRANREGVEAEVSWAFQPASLAEMVGVADVIVIATLSGESTPGPTVYSTDGSAFLTSEINRFHVTETLKGTVPGEDVAVVRTNGRGIVGEDTVAILGPDGPYDPEPRYLLFLKRTPSDLYAVVNDEGRYAIGDEDRVRPHGSIRARETNGRVSRSIRGRKLPQVLGLVRAALHTQ